MFTFRLNTTTEKVYSEMLPLYNSYFNIKFTIQNILPYAVTHFLKHGNPKYVKHYNLVNNYINQEFILDKGLYKELKKFIKDNITLQDLLNFALNLYVIPFKSDFIKEVIDNDRILIVLNHFKFLDDGFKIKESTKSDQGYDTEFIITACPICGNDSFYINPETLEVGCFRKNNCSLKNFNISDIISVIMHMEKQNYPTVISNIYDLIIKDFKQTSAILTTLEPSFIKCTTLKNKINIRIAEIEYKIFLVKGDKTIEHYKEELQQLNDQIKKIYENENEEEKRVSLKNNILLNNGKIEHGYLLNKGFSKDLLDDLGLFYIDEDITKDYQTNSFRYRLCYPIYSVNGVLVGVQGRSVFDNNKERREFLKNDILFKEYYESSRKKNLNLTYGNSLHVLSNEDNIRMKIWNNINNKIINSSGFHKSEHLYLLNKYINKRSKVIRAIVVEGLKDAIMLYSYNLNATAIVSTMGSNISDKQVSLLKEYFPNAEIILGYDSDFAGIEGNINAYDKLTKVEFSNITFIIYPKEIKDFGSISNGTNTRNAIVTILKSRINFKTYSSYLQNSNLANEKLLKNIDQLCRY